MSSQRGSTAVPLAGCSRWPRLETPSQCQQRVGIFREVQPQHSVPISEVFGLLHCKVIVLIPHGCKRGTCCWEKSLCGCSDLSFMQRVNVSSMPDPDARWPLMTKNQAPASCKGLVVPSLSCASSPSSGHASDPFQLMSHSSAVYTSLSLLNSAPKLWAGLWKPLCQSSSPG